MPNQQSEKNTHLLFIRGSGAMPLSKQKALTMCNMARRDGSFAVVVPTRETLEFYKQNNVRERSELEKAQKRVAQELEKLQHREAMVQKQENGLSKIEAELAMGAEAFQKANDQDVWQALPKIDNQKPLNPEHREENRRKAREIMAEHSGDNGNTEGQEIEVGKTLVIC